MAVGLTDPLGRAFDRIDDFQAVQRGVVGDELLEAVSRLQESVGISDEPRAVIAERLGGIAGSERAPGHVLLGVIVGLDDSRESLRRWLLCLQTGDSMAHFGLGYTLFALGRHHEAYRHLRYYVGIAPAAAWNWCWLAKAALAIGEIDEARQAYERAVSLDPDDETDAREQLAALDVD